MVNYDEPAEAPKLVPVEEEKVVWALWPTNDTYPPQKYTIKQARKIVQHKLKLSRKSAWQFILCAEGQRLIRVNTGEGRVTITDKSLIVKTLWPDGNYGQVLPLADAVALVMRGLRVDRKLAYRLILSAGNSVHGLLEVDIARQTVETTEKSRKILSAAPQPSLVS